MRARPALAVPHVAAFGAVNAYLWPRTGKDRLPVVVYSGALLAMSLAALDTALEKFGGLELPAHEGLVMATYATAQALLAG